MPSWWHFASRILRRLFAEGAFSQAFVPIIAGVKAQEGEEAALRLIDAVASVLLWALLATSVLGVLGAPLLVWLLASGLSGNSMEAAIVMTRWMFPYILCMSGVALAAGILNTWKRFMVPAVTPVLLNLSVIATGWGLQSSFVKAGYPGVYALAVGVMLGGVLQLLVQWPALRAVGAMPRISIRPSAIKAAAGHPGVKRTLTGMAPALLGVGCLRCR